MGERFTAAHAIANVAKWCANSQRSQWKQERVHGTLTRRQPYQATPREKARRSWWNESRKRALRYSGLTQPGLAAKLGTWLGQRLPKRFSKDKRHVFHSHFYFSRSLASVDHWCLWRISLIWPTNHWCSHAFQVSSFITAWTYSAESGPTRLLFNIFLKVQLQMNRHLSAQRHSLLYITGTEPAFHLNPTPSI